MKRTILAVCGKGGVGKTTVSAMLARHLAGRAGKRALLVDADPAGGLAMALGIPAQRTLNDVRLETVAEIKRGEATKQDLARAIDFLLLDAVTEHGHAAFLPIGRPDEVGCYCSINSLLREAIELLTGHFDAVVIDAEAGIEQVNREVMRSVTHLLLVADASAKALKVAETIRDVARGRGGPKHVGLFVNRLRSEKEAADIATRSNLTVVGWAPEDDTIRRFDAVGKSYFELPDCPASLSIEPLAAWAGW